MNNQSTSGDEELAITNRTLSIRRILVPTDLTSDGSKVFNYAVAVREPVWSRTNIVTCR
jgi:hypothetical protein